MRAAPPDRMMEQHLGLFDALRVEHFASELVALGHLLRPFGETLRKEHVGRLVDQVSRQAHAGSNLLAESHSLLVCTGGRPSEEQRELRQLRFLRLVTIERVATEKCP